MMMRSTATGYAHAARLTMTSRTEPLKKSSPHKCCVEIVTGYIKALGRPEDWCRVSRIALHCITCRSSLVWTQAGGWTREAP